MFFENNKIIGFCRNGTQCLSPLMYTVRYPVNQTRIIFSRRFTMKLDCLIVDDEIALAETTSEYFNMFEVKTAFVT